MSDRSYLDGPFFDPSHRDWADRVEAVADLLRTKEQVFAALSDIAGDETILATQSGLLPIDPIAAATARPEQVLGLHFHAPVGPARLVEVIPGSRTDPQAVASVAALVRGTLGRIAVRSGTGGGTLPERITAAARDAGIAMLVPGVPIGRIDGVMAQWGLPQGIFRQIDMIGCDVVLARGRLLARGTGFPTAHLDALAAHGPLPEHRRSFGPVATVISQGKLF